MKRAAVVIEMKHDRSRRGRPGVFGRAMIREKTGVTYEVEFSRLDGEPVWFADSMWSERAPVFRHARGERGGRQYALAGYVEKAVDTYFASWEERHHV